MLFTDLINKFIKLSFLYKHLSLASKRLPYFGQVHKQNLILIYAQMLRLDQEIIPIMAENSQKPVLNVFQISGSND